MLNDSTCGEPDAFSRVKIPRLDLQHPERSKVTSGRNVVDRHTIKATIAGKESLKKKWKRIPNTDNWRTNMDEEAMSRKSKR